MQERDLPNNASIKLYIISMVHRMPYNILMELSIDIPILFVHGIKIITIELLEGKEQINYQQRQLVSKSIMSTSKYKSTITKVQ